MFKHNPLIKKKNSSKLPYGNLGRKEKAHNPWCRCCLLLCSNLTDLYYLQNKSGFFCWFKSKNLNKKMDFLILKIWLFNVNSHWETCILQTLTFELTLVLLLRGNFTVNLYIMHTSTIVLFFIFSANFDNLKKNVEMLIKIKSQVETNKQPSRHKFE